MVKWIVLAGVVALTLGVLRVRAAGRRIDAILVETLGERPDRALPPETPDRPVAVDLDGSQRTPVRPALVSADPDAPDLPDGARATPSPRTAPDPLRRVTSIPAVDPAGAQEPDQAAPTNLPATTPVPPQHDRRRLLAS